MVGWTQAGAGFVQHQSGIIQGNSPLIIQVQRVKDAVERFKPPGVEVISVRRNLQGALVIGAQEDAGGPTIMFFIWQDGGMRGETRKRILIRFFAAVKPIQRVSVGRFHMRGDQVRVVEDVFGFHPVHPNTMQAARSTAVAQNAALHRFRL